MADLPIEKVEFIIQTGDPEKIKELTVLCFKNPEIRTIWAVEPSLWVSLINRIETVLIGENSEHSQLLLQRLLQLLNNLSATSNSGSTALACGACDKLVNLNFSTENESRIQWQIMSNLSHGFSSDHQDSLDLLVSSLVANQRTWLSGHPSVVGPYLSFVQNVAQIVSPEVLTELLLNKDLLEYVLDLIPQWFEGGSEFDTHISLSTQVLYVGMKKGLLPTLVSFYDSRLSSKVTLFKLVDSIFASSKLGPEFDDASFWTGPSGTGVSAILRSELKTTIDQIIPYMVRGNREEEGALLYWNLMCTLLELSASVLPSLPEEQLNEYRSGVLHEVVALLKAAKNLPAKTKLKDVTQNQEPDPTDFPLLRSSVIPVIATLVKGNEAAQNEVRVSGGLGVILESCVIDANNPFMKERAIVCIRYLLDGNQENQNLVASMEARQVADPEALEKAGYETEIVNGQMKIKQKPVQQQQQQQK